MPGMIGRKIGMTSIIDSAGRSVACTVIQAEENVVTQIKTKETDGYEAVQLAFGDKREKNTTSPMMGHFKRANTTPKRKLKEFKEFGQELALGQSLKVDEIFAEGEFVDITGISKGKGFQGVVKRHGFAGVGAATHGQHNRARHPGSIGACSFPSRVFKGLRMAGRMGGDQVKVENLRIMKIFPEKGLIVVKGCIPGPKKSFVFIEK